jgi:hypothetical protein
MNFPHTHKITQGKDNIYLSLSTSKPLKKTKCPKTIPYSTKNMTLFIIQNKVSFRASFQNTILSFQDMHQKNYHE